MFQYALHDSAVRWQVYCISFIHTSMTSCYKNDALRVISTTVAYYNLCVTFPAIFQIVDTVKLLLKAVDR